MAEELSQSKKSDELPRIHTFESDVEELMRQQQVSKATIALAESKREAEGETEALELFDRQSVLSAGGLVERLRHNAKLIVLIGGAVIVLGVGVWMLVALRDDTSIAPPATRTAPKPAATIELQGRERRAGAIAAIQKIATTVAVPQNELRLVSITRDDKPLTTGDFFSLLETKASPELIRAFGTVPTLGIYGFQGGQPFLLFLVLSYDHAFSGMLAWEETLLDDFGPIFDVHQEELLSNVGSTTEETLRNRIEIKDVIIRNKDARAAFAPDGAIVFVYSFIDKQTLVFTTNEETLKALINKAGEGRLK